MSYGLGRYGLTIHGIGDTATAAPAEAFDPDNLQVVIDGTTVTLTWDASPMVPV